MYRADYRCFTAVYFRSMTMSTTRGIYHMQLPGTCYRSVVVVTSMKYAYYRGRAGIMSFEPHRVKIHYRKNSKIASVCILADG